MTGKGQFYQNIIAVIWDFDKTLSPDYMQKPIFDAYGLDEERFWREVRALPGYYAKAGIRVQEDTCYLGHLLSYVRHERLPGLTNATLRELGQHIRFFPGLPKFFDRLNGELKTDAFEAGDLKLEHYVVSTGLYEMVRGSAVAPFLKDVWASIFIESPAPPEADLSATPPPGPISQIASFLDNTTKTRALFEINKGVNVEKGISVNDSIPEEDRRVPFKNMIYVADGPSDIPSFSVVRKHGGVTLAVYNPASERHFEQGELLHRSGRVDWFGKADYRDESETARWLRLQVRRIADRILKERKAATSSRIQPGPVHDPDRVR